VTTTINTVQNCIAGVTTHGMNVSVTKDDSRFVTYIGGTGQDSDTYVYVYDKTLGCRWLNTQTGQVGGQWGPTGAYVGDVGYNIHNARISKDGKWARITAAGNALAGMYFWNIETLTVTACSTLAPPYCGGHLVTGFSHFINQRQLNDGMDFAIRSMASVNTAAPLVTPLLTPAQYANDTHPSWNNVQSDETQPVCMEAYRSDDLVQRAWDGEIICIETDGLASTVWRFAQHRSHYVSFWDTPRANLSQDGRFVLFTSNWEQTLGLQPDGTLRDDAFIVELAPPNTVAPSPPTNLTVQ
jgi:hypothetical protein